MTNIKNQISLSFCFAPTHTFCRCWRIWWRRLTQITVELYRWMSGWKVGWITSLFWSYWDWRWDTRSITHIQSIRKRHAHAHTLTHNRIRFTCKISPKKVLCSGEREEITLNKIKKHILLLAPKFALQNLWKILLNLRKHTCS